MTAALYVLAKTISLIISVIVLAMFLRVIIPLFVTEPESNRFYVFVFLITEIILAPVRVILDKMGIGKNSPFDFSFIIGYILLILIQSALPVI